MESFVIPTGMHIVHDIRRRLRALVWPLFAAMLGVYFVYHGIYGDRGLLARSAVRAEVAVAASERAAIAGTRSTLERQVRLLRESSLDPDMLGEQARRLVNLGRPSEVVILAPWD